ncbi:hypothetical protein BGAL_0367g00020 [Botrytis galanthina]|uniref:Uncharacterized protein n=1 Tax=Botrytis galanthina TaxID=278940 RepID=A0A4V4HTS8_9HELO|nr:hypothetical protein BGAL_0367g00020 [Botrytis galanthina]
MGDESLDEHGLPNNDALARRKALMERLRSPPKEAGVPKPKKRLSVSHDDDARRGMKKKISLSVTKPKLPTIVG